MKKTILYGVIAMVLLYCIIDGALMLTGALSYTSVLVQQNNPGSFNGTTTVNTFCPDNMLLIRYQVYCLMY